MKRIAIGLVLGLALAAAGVAGAAVAVHWPTTCSTFTCVDSHLNNLHSGVQQALTRTMTPGPAGATGPRGDTGATGPQGAQGAAGTAGLNGTAIGVRTSLQTATTITLTTGQSSFLTTSLPLTNNTWTQAATEIDQIIGGNVTVVAPASCTLNGSSYADYPNVKITVYLDGTEIGQANALVPVGTTMTFPITAGGDAILNTSFVSGSQASHIVTMTAEAGVNSGATFSCSGTGAVTAVALDVVTMQ